MADEHRQHRRGPDQHGDLVPLQQLEELGRVEARHGDHGRAHRQGQGQGDQEPHDVGEGRHGEQRVALADAQPGADLADRGDQVGMGQLDPLGSPVVPLE